MASLLRKESENRDRISYNMPLLRRLLDVKQPGKDKLSGMHMTNDRVKATFAALDEDGSGRLDRAEFAKALRSMGVEIDPSECKSLFEAMDANRDGGVSADEFCSVQTPPRSPSSVHSAVPQNPNSFFPALSFSSLQ